MGRVVGVVVVERERGESERSESRESVGEVVEGGGGGAGRSRDTNKTGKKRGPRGKGVQKGVHDRVPVQGSVEHGAGGLQGHGGRGEDKPGSTPGESGGEEG